ncbi:hypothetical protein [Paenibacillus kandeliae]|uniref:hypothetical protein n=1 Tax=Paenibacillus kandeliae TaxID=3231269 RepID=UPI003459E232
MERPTNREVKTDMELLAAALAEVRVQVEDEKNTIVDYGGSIKIYTPEFIKIQDTYYSREMYKFITCK